MRLIIAALTVILFSCRSQYYYVVRHAEKATVTKDSAMFSAANPPLSEAGKVRSYVLRDELKNKGVRYIYSTNYVRTKSTALPLSEELRIPIQLYNPSKDSLAPFISKLKSIGKRSVLVVGHSNTVDDIVNTFLGETKVPGDLNDRIYDNLYIIKRKGDKMTFSQKKFGYPSNPE